MQHVAKVNLATAKAVKPLICGLERYPEIVSLVSVKGASHEGFQDVLLDHRGNKLYVFINHSNNRAAQT